MDAGFNYNMLYHGPGANAHNRYFTKRLIFDSIDWLDNNTLDGTFELSSYTEAEAYLCSRDPVDAVTRP